MTRSRLRVTIDVAGKPRKLLSLAVRTNGDLILDVKPAPFHRPDPASTKLEQRVISQRASVHKSPRALNGNLMTFTTALSDAPPIRTQSFTTAIKAANSAFAPIYFRRFPALAAQDDTIDDGTVESISLGELDERLFNLIIGVYIGRSDREFVCDFDPIDIFQTRCGDFNVVILATFLTFPAIQHADGLNYWTTTAEGTSVTGGAEFDSCMEFMRMCAHLTDLYIAKMADSDTPTDAYKGVARFFRTGTLQSSPEVEAHFIEAVRFLDDKFPDALKPPEPP